MRREREREKLGGGRRGEVKKGGRVVVGGKRGKELG